MSTQGCKSTLPDDPIQIQYCETCGCRNDNITCMIYLESWKRDMVWSEK